MTEKNILLLRIKFRPPARGQWIYWLSWRSIWYDWELTLQSSDINFARVEMQLAPRGPLENSVRTEDGAVGPQQQSEDPETRIHSHIRAWLLQKWLPALHTGESTNTHTQSHQGLVTAEMTACAVHRRIYKHAYAVTSGPGYCRNDCLRCTQANLQTRIRSHIRAWSLQKLLPTLDTVEPTNTHNTVTSAPGHCRNDCMSLTQSNL
jgi:hypothetical protein